MVSSFRKTQAKVVLAVLFFIHLIQRVLFFWKRKNGLKRFFELYGPDSIFPVSAKERAAFPSFQKCQACSLCTFTCTAVREGTAPSAFEPKYVLLGLGRSGHESEIFIDEWLPCLECQTCTIDCPNGVPIHTMVEQIRERRNRIGFRS